MRIVNYPIVMINDDKDQVVAFEKASNGVAIAGEYAMECGEFCSYHEDWLTNKFTPFTGTITYKNGKPVSTEEKN